MRSLSMVRQVKTGLTLAVTAVVLAACTEGGGQQDTMPTQADGAAFFAENCASCHGSDGRGLGVSSADLAQSPRDLTTLSAQNGGTFPAARALSYIYGDPDNGHLARVMPQFGPDMAEDLVPVEIDGVLTPTPRELAGLLAYLESIQR
jgi:mono/diheme cytochrome c family protein